MLSKTRAGHPPSSEPFGYQALFGMGGITVCLLQEQEVVRGRFVSNNHKFGQTHGVPSRVLLVLSGLVLLGTPMAGGHAVLPIGTLILVALSSLSNKQPGAIQFLFASLIPWLALGISISAAFIRQTWVMGVLNGLVICIVLITYVWGLYDRNEVLSRQLLTIVCWSLSLVFALVSLVLVLFELRHR